LWTTDTCQRLLKVDEVDIDFNLLTRTGVTRREWFSLDQPVEELDGPVMDIALDSICLSCHKSMVSNKLPLMALANGNWLGKIPMQLTDLSFTEQLLVSRVWHNYCIVKVSSGMCKMRANAVSFANSTPKVYNILPPPHEELDEVLAVIYTGPCQPTEKDFQRTPLLVRRNKVRLALDWLKLNHCDYCDIDISLENLHQYPENNIPVVIDYCQSTSNKDPEATAVNNLNE
jgi:hypothetical protein